MSIEVSCDCAMTYRLPDRFAGKRCRCRECGDSIRVPSLRGDSGEDNSGDTSSEDLSSSDSVSSDEDEEVAQESEAAPAPKKKAPATPRRMKSQPSESLHQMAPLNLSESRCMDPPAARARIKKAKAAAASVKAKKRAAMGPESESEIDTAQRPPKKKAKAEKSKLDKKKKGSKKPPVEDKRALRRARDERRDDESDDADEDTDEDERPKKKKKSKDKKAKKSDKPEKASPRKLGGKKRKTADDADESEAAEGEGEEGADEKPRLSPRQQARRQQMIMLGASFGALILVGVFFIIINSVSASKKESTEKKFKDAKAKVAAAREVARTATNIADAEKAFADAIAFVQDKSSPMPEEEEQGDFIKDFKKFEAEQAFFKKIAEAREKLSSNPQEAFDLFNNNVVGADDELIREIGLQGLLATNDSRAGSICLAYTGATSPAVKALARKGALQYCGAKEVAPLLAAIIREEGASTPNGKLAVERALERNNVDPNSIIAVTEKDTDAQHLVAALNLMSSLCDPKFKDACQKLTTSSNEEVSKTAQRVLAELRGQDKASDTKH